MVPQHNGSFESVPPYIIHVPHPHTRKSVLRARKFPHPRRTIPTHGRHQPTLALTLNEPNRLVRQQFDQIRIWTTALSHFFDETKASWKKLSARRNGHFIVAPQNVCIVRAKLRTRTGISMTKPTINADKIAYLRVINKIKL